MVNLNDLRISVLMSVYKNDKIEYFKMAIESLCNQTFPPSEVIIIIDGFVDKEIDSYINQLSVDELFKIIRLPKNIGLALALNKGIKECKFDFIARMDSDDICLPNRFEKQIEYFKKKPNVCMVGCNIDEFVGKQSNIVSQRIVPTEHKKIVNFLKSKCPFNHPTVMFKKKAVLAAGNYQPFYLKEDIDLWLRMYKIGCVFGNINESLLLYRLSDDTFKRRGGWKYTKSEFKIFKSKYKIGLINFIEFIYFLSLTIPIRLAPSFLRKFIYTKLLR